MWIFLLSVLFGVSAGETVTVTAVTGYVGGSVLLPCNCSNRNMEEEFKWQVNETNLMIRQLPNNFKNYYEDRVKTFFKDVSSNCSVLLTNISHNDTGQYKCIFTAETYTYLLVNLTVNGILPWSVHNRQRGITPTTARKGEYKFPETKARIFYAIIPFMLVLLLSLILHCRRKPHGGFTEREMENHQEQTKLDELQSENMKVLCAEVVVSH